MQNHLKDQTSPYLLQHAENPVDWYPWGKEAFARARAEDKPVFLSIGYSTCHWCHVMAHESFEDEEIANILNQYFISVKVDKEERPDIDNIYMSVCQAFTGSGGWPATIFLTPQQKPFFAGTYFPKTSRYGRPGLKELLIFIHEKWENEKASLLESADGIIAALNRNLQWEKEGRKSGTNEKEGPGMPADNTQLPDEAFLIYQNTFDKQYGGFGGAPKFPMPHNLLFLMRYYEKTGNETALEMAEKTLEQMRRGGIFDQIGGGFCRYSTDQYFLVPHFEKMLYDNALLILTYAKAYQLTEKPGYLETAKKTAGYILREMTSEENGFYSAQDADSEGVEGKYYLLEPQEVESLLGNKAGSFVNRYFDITLEGNFEGKNIPNLLKTGKKSGNQWEERTRKAEYNQKEENPKEEVEKYLPALYEYRKNRYALHLDDKILTSWNGLMIAGMCYLYRVTGNDRYLEAAVKAYEFIRSRLCSGETVFVSYCAGRHSEKGFLDDYAYLVFALLSLYEATFQSEYLENARKFCKKAAADFYDEKQGGFYLYGLDSEQLILRPKEAYDGALPSGNSVMAYVLVHLFLITGEDWAKELAEHQLQYLSLKAASYPAGYAFFLMALSDYTDMPDTITIVKKDGKMPEGLSLKIPLHTTVHILEEPTSEYPLKNDKTTFYVCKGRSCQPPVNEL